MSKRNLPLFACISFAAVFVFLFGVPSTVSAVTCESMKSSSGTWQNIDFTCSITFQDPGGSGLDFCKYRVISTDPDVAWTTVNCTGENPVVLNVPIGVGASQNCRAQGANSCWIQMEAGDNAGNQSQNSYFFNIDYGSPSAVPPFAPADDSTSVPTNTNLVITFNEAVNVNTQETKNILIKTGSTIVQTIPVNSAAVTKDVSSTIVTINPPSDLAASTSYYIMIDAGAFKDLAGNPFAGIVDNTTWNFTTAAAGAPDTTPPTCAPSVPSNGDTGVSVSTNLVMICSESVNIVANKNVYIVRSANNTIAQTINTNSGLFSGAGTNTITINPSQDLAPSASFYITIDQGTFEDLAGNDYAGIIADSTIWNFTTAGDTTKPTIQSLFPADGALNVPVNTNLVVTFSEPVTARASGDSEIYIKEWWSDSIVEVIQANSSSVTGSGTNTITIRPTGLRASTVYYILIGTQAFVDAQNNLFDGISIKGDWNFTTGALAGPRIVFFPSKTLAVPGEQITLYITAEAPVKALFTLSALYQGTWHQILYPPSWNTKCFYNPSNCTMACTEGQPADNVSTSFGPFTQATGGTYTYTGTVSAFYDCSWHSVQTTAKVVFSNPPTVNAGPDRNVFEGQKIVLAGSATDSDGFIVSTQWSCVDSGGNPVNALGNANTLTPTFTGPYVAADTNYTCTLVATDNAGFTSSDATVITSKNKPIIVITTFDATPKILSTATPSTKIIWDVGSGGGPVLSYVKIWRAPFHATNCNDSSKANCVWTQIFTVNAPASAVTWACDVLGTDPGVVDCPSDDPTDGVWWYGMHVGETEGSYTTETEAGKTPVKVTSDKTGPGVVCFPSSGAFVNNSIVIVSCGFAPGVTDGVSIYYTTDGSNPISSGTRALYNNSSKPQVTGNAQTKTFKAVGYDTLSNVGSVLTLAYQFIDYSVVTITNKPANPSNVANPVFAFTASASPTSIECRIDSVNPADYATCVSPKQFALSEGAHTFDVRGINVLGTGQPTSYTWAIDYTAASVTAFKVDGRTKSDTVTRVTTPTIPITWIAADTGGAYIDKVNIWRAAHNDTNCNNTNKTGCAWTQIGQDIAAPPNLNTWNCANTNTGADAAAGLDPANDSDDCATDTPIYGASWYGIHVVDKATNCITEEIYDDNNQITPSRGHCGGIAFDRFDSSYYVNVDAGTFQDLAGDTYAGISNTSAWVFRTTENGQTPHAISFLPADNGVMHMNRNLVITFNEAVNIIPNKSIEIWVEHPAAIIQTINTTTDSSAFSGAGTDTITINPPQDLTAGIAYYINIENGTFQDLAGNGHPGINTIATWNFAAVNDTAGPTISSTNPTNSAPVQVQANFSITFNEPVYLGGNKNIYIKHANGAIAQTINTNTDFAAFSGNGTATITINPAQDLATTGNLVYYINIDAGAFNDFANNPFAGISDGGTTWQFLAVNDTTPPFVKSLDPYSGSGFKVPFNTYLTILFSEPVRRVGNKNIFIKKSSDNTIFQTINTTDNSGAFLDDGNFLIGIAPPTALAESISYYINIEAGTFQDLAGNNYAGISNSTTWYFTPTDGPYSMRSLLFPSKWIAQIGETINIIAQGIVPSAALPRWYIPVFADDTQIGLLNEITPPGCFYNLGTCSWVSCSSTGSVKSFLIPHTSNTKASFSYFVSINPYYGPGNVSYLCGYQGRTSNLGVSVSFGNPPTANAGLDRTAQEGQQITLSGSATDDEGVSAYEWTCVNAAGNLIHTLNNSLSASPVFTAPYVTGDTNYICTLIAKDNIGLTGSDAATITVTNRPLTAVVVSPAGNGLAPGNTNISIAFSHPVNIVANKNITIKKGSDNATAQTINTTTNSSAFFGDGTFNIYPINIPLDLPVYYARVDMGPIRVENFTDPEPINLQDSHAIAGYCADAPGLPVITLSFEFNDPDPGAYLKQFQVQINDTPDFTSPLLLHDSGIVSVPSIPDPVEHGERKSYAPQPSPFAYNTTYYWRVKVWDNTNFTSSWVSGASFATPVHHYPVPGFSWNPRSPTPKEPVKFTDTTIFAPSSTSKTWEWDFGDGGPTAPQQNPTHAYTSSGNYAVILQSSDDAGSCEKQNTVSVGLPFPGWREVSPF